MFLYGKVNKVILLYTILGLLTSCSKFTKTSSKGSTRVTQISPFLWGNESLVDQVSKKIVSKKSDVEFIQPSIGFIEGEIKDNSTEVSDSRQKSEPFLLVTEKLEEIDLKGGGIAPLLEDNEEESAKLSKTKITNRDKLIDFSQKLPDGSKESDTYKQASNKEIFNQSLNQGRSSVGFAYLRDFGSYTGGAGGSDSFKRIFGDSSDAVSVGFLMLSFKQFFKKGKTNFSYRVNGGVGLNQAPALFGASGDRAKEVISLWTIPFDVTLDMEMMLGKSLKLELQGGPSLVGLFQNRNDKMEGEDKKRVGQFGFGGVIGSALKIDLMQYKRMASLDLLSSLSVSDYYLNIEMRYHAYFLGFLDDVKVNGLSLGLGISYDFL
ncbi:hypothetical protein OAK75_03495 [Bacteriovoracales bacterium]|nr:hypothetical protein [Bacteriovoracales bacterium]